MGNTFSFKERCDWVHLECSGPEMRGQSGGGCIGALTPPPSPSSSDSEVVPLITNLLLINPGVCIGRIGIEIGCHFHFHSNTHKEPNITCIFIPVTPFSDGYPKYSGIVGVPTNATARDIGRLSNRFNAFWIHLVV